MFPKRKQEKALTNILDKQLKILTPKQMLQRLPIALAGNTLENLLNEICQVIYFFYCEKEITKNDMEFR